ncbi:RNA polymerase sigma factor [Lactiplantibacillus daowaiensis]|uniref:RNA polymerase sigma factor n=1 Tax=Lactiplantibacillus daowaiensis TaxID=2559918 RepID=A0ABW1S141_9LACO|nr:RNA polymerase sigma factor [Lactiplantibacillus daowaiensis]
MDLKQYEGLLAELAVDVQRYLVHRGADEALAADIVQDMFVKVLEMDLVLPPNQLRPYLFRVAWSTYLDEYRRTRRYAAIVNDYLVPALREAVPPITDEQPELLAALRRLSAKEQQLLLLRYDEALSIKAIAAELKIRPAAVKMRLHRVHRKLEKHIRGVEHE